MEFVALDDRYPKTRDALALLASGGIQVDPENYLRAIGDYHRLCSTWNLSAKLMSKGDLEDHFDEHIADSLSLVPHIHKQPNCRYVDIGSGGGLPAVPVALALPRLRTCMVERSEVKSGFLRQVVRTFPQARLEVVEGRHPDQPVRSGPTVYTARAIEKPARFDLDLLSRLEPGDAYLLQRPVPSTLPDGLTATLVEDEFSHAQLRRGVLYIVRRQVPRGTCGN